MNDYTTKSTKLPCKSERAAHIRNKTRASCGRNSSPRTRVTRCGRIRLRGVSQKWGISRIVAKGRATIREIHFCEKLLVQTSGALPFASYCREALPRYRLPMLAAPARAAGTKPKAARKNQLVRLPYQLVFSHLICSIIWHRSYMP